MEWIFVEILNEWISYSVSKRVKYNCIAQFFLKFNKVVVTFLTLSTYIMVNAVIILNVTRF